MKELEKYFAEKKLQEIEHALSTGKISDLARAADIDISDPNWGDMPLTEAAQYMQVRLIEMLRRIKELREK